MLSLARFLLQARRRAPRSLCMAWLILGACAVASAQSSAPSPRVLDRFDDPAAWRAVASDDAQASVHAAQGPDGPAIRLDFDLGGTAGYAIARRALPLDLPSNFELGFYVRGDAPMNELQLKLIDASGDNVWWFHRRDFEFPHEWKLVRIKNRQIEFAWGPTTDRRLTSTATIEFVVSAGRGGGRGSVYLSGLVLRELPPEPAVLPAPVARASSSLPGAGPALALDGDVATAWRSDPATGKAQSLTIDLGSVREVGGLIVHWRDGAYASRYDVEFSDDGERWRSVREVTGGSGRLDAFRLPDAQTRFLRLALNDGPSEAYSIAEIEIKDAVFGASANALVEALAREAPRGAYPRGFSGQQTYWTLVGIDGGGDGALLSEDGVLEVGRGGFSIEPVIVDGARATTWADVHARPFLVDDYLPLPGVVWREPGWTLRVTAFASGSRSDSKLVARYDVGNPTAHKVRTKLVLAVRPFQVNPPTQSLNTVGGVSMIQDIRWDGATLTVNGRRKLFAAPRPERVQAVTSSTGALPELVAAQERMGPFALHDDAGLASAALTYTLEIPPHGSATVGVVIPLSGTDEPQKLYAKSSRQWLAREQRVVAAGWREKLNRVTLRVPSAAKPLADTLRTALAHLLLSRDGPILRPGTGSYSRSWIRDGAMIAESLLRLGHAEIAADYLRWYAPHQFANGKVPCCVDARGADPVPENDSPGELIFLVAEVYRHTRDRPLLEAMWPRVEAAASYLESLRQKERTDSNLVGGRHAFYGLLPASISHEGYAAKPMHSYWDDFWALKGFNAAVEIADALGDREAASRFAVARDTFRRELAASLQAAIADHRIDYIPGCAELGDFDPTSTTIALAPRGSISDVPAAATRATFERYWREFVDRRDGRSAWEVYTPYELRLVGAFVRLGWRDRAQELLAFFLAGRRPPEWNQWAEVVGRDARQPRFVGDMPHAWVASDFIRSVLDLFAYEREDDRALVIGAGIPVAWLDGPGIGVKDLRTPYGKLSYSLGKERGRVVLHVGQEAKPPGGVVFVWPWERPPGPTRVNGREATWQNRELRVSELPATVVVQQR
jgi:F5/8 type C domain-containing protein